MKYLINLFNQLSLSIYSFLLNVILNLFQFHYYSISYSTYLRFNPLIVVSLKLHIPGFLSILLEILCRMLTYKLGVFKTAFEFENYIILRYKYVNGKI